MFYISEITLVDTYFLDNFHKEELKQLTVKRGFATDSGKKVFTLPTF